MAVLWFQTTIAKLSGMPSPTRQDLEKAAREYFAYRQNELDGPRDIPDANFDSELAFNIEETEARIETLDNQLKVRVFDEAVRGTAALMAQGPLQDLSESNPDLALDAQQLAARAERQAWKYLIHLLSTPHKEFVADDPVFSPQSSPTQAQQKMGQVSETNAGVTLGKGIELHLSYLHEQNLGISRLTETQRVLKWLTDDIAPVTALSEISVDQIRDFRDGLQRLGRGKQGKSTSFRSRVSNDPNQRLKFVTRERYWRSIKFFFSWFKSEFSLPNPAESLLFQGGKSEIVQSPKAFSDEELRRLFATPLYSGYLSRQRPKQPGAVHARDGRWWSGILMLMTGLRAGDCAQLTPSDFEFDDAVPHIIVQPGKLPDGRTKTSKFGMRTHRVPIMPILLELGLKEFVARRQSQKSKERVLREFRLGVSRASDGMSKFWGSYLKEFGLHSEGRSTHVFRHTLAAKLRAHGVMDEDIGAILGHTPGNVTGGYGGPQPLARQFETLSKVDFDFNMIEALGGPYDPKAHQS